MPGLVVSVALPPPSPHNRRQIPDLRHAMLSYQHMYHAGNFADVHKHLILTRVLDYLMQKDKPFCYVDTHAGRGVYDLQSGPAQKTGEAQGGLWKLDPADTPPLAQRYVDSIRAMNPRGGRRFYPGSPQLVLTNSRPGDRLALIEQHPQEYEALETALGHEARVGLHRRNGHEALPGLVPPKEKRGLVLIDPSYEVKTEYHQVVDTVGKAWKKWPTGMYLIWYPMLPAEGHVYLLKKLRQAGIPRILRSELWLRSPRGDAGMYGSGMVVINPPWTLENELRELAPWLVNRLSDAPERGMDTEWLVGETPQK
jgi:23S rRNA (adenine2030-N6)-methyltransferase